MNVRESLSEIAKLAKADAKLKASLIATKNADDPALEFCRICKECGYPIDAMELIGAGEESYAAMKRSTNGGGENSPLMDGEDDLYESFIIELEFFS